MPNILIVDDEVGMREGCRRALVRQGYSVSTAELAPEGLHMLRDEPFDLILLDAMMPGMSGLEFLDRVQERDPNIVCVMITGYATVDLAAQAMKKGAHGFLPKPFTSDELLTVVRSGLDERERRLGVSRQREQEEETRELERARQEQAKLDAIAGRFLLVVVHELRNPAGVIKSYLELMRGPYVDAVEQRDILDSLERRATQLLSMLDDLLELAQLKELQSPAKLEPTPVADLLEETAAQFQPAASAKGVALQVQVEAHPTLQAHAGHLRSLWRHLLDNAVSYTPSGRILVRLVESPTGVVVTINDTGIGISTEDVTRIFQEFYRSQAARNEKELGTGLGLPIVCQLLKLYQGSILVDSTPGQGTTFTVTLPTSSALSAAADIT